MCDNCHNCLTFVTLIQTLNTSVLEILYYYYYFVIFFLKSTFSMVLCVHFKMLLFNRRVRCFHLTYRGLKRQEDVALSL